MPCFGATPPTRHRGAAGAQAHWQTAVGPDHGTAFAWLTLWNLPLAFGPHLRPHELMTPALSETIWN